MAPLVTLSDLKAYVGIASDDEADDASLQMALDAASAQIEQWCDRTFTQDATPVARYYTATTRSVVEVDPFAITTGLVVATDTNGDGTYETTVTVDTDFTLDPPNAVAEGRPWTRLLTTSGRSWPTGYRAIRVTARYGLAAIPAPVKAACLIQSTRLWRRKDSPYGVAGSPEFGTEVRLLSRLDPDVEALLRPYRRTWWVV